MESFEQLAAQYEPMIYDIIRGLNIYKNNEEFHQLGLIALWQAWKNHDEEKGAFLSYAYSTVKGKMMLELTRQTKEIDRYVYPEADFWEIIEDTSSASRSAITQELFNKCGMLSDNQLKWLQYTLCDQLSVRQIAEKERVSLSAVKNWRQGAREKLKNILKNN
jgi:RNA polymerase sigma factor (sigma-70 family)